jgi:hypothetical protein
MPIRTGLVRAGWSAPEGDPALNHKVAVMAAEASGIMRVRFIIASLFRREAKEEAWSS